MITPHTSDNGLHAGAAAGRKSEFNTTSSKMFDTYLTDIEQLLHHQMWSAALNDALALPHIATALSDPKQRSCAEQFKAWCATWLRADNAVPAESMIDGEQLYSMWAERTGSTPEKAARMVPLKALRQLRLRRLARPMSPGCHPSQPTTSDADAVQAIEVCTLLVAAAQRWYTRLAARNDTVQANLARLAVMR